ncbi:MAG: class I SAM-dependent methyltransferase [Lacibacter sp.]|nr:class I SAM-dependent methyltransferase [Lacibacter sp.]
MSVLKQAMIQDTYMQSNLHFDKLYPAQIRSLAARHWTPLPVAHKAAKFLAADKNARVLDIGSGVGKFCLAASSYHKDALFFGVEQRKDMVQYAEQAKSILDISNVFFLHSNFTQLDFREYDHFYFYNSFYENLSGTDKIDESIDYSMQLYNYYNHFLYKLLDTKPEGTRLATYHSIEDEVPPSYHVVGTAFDHLLKFWIKV